jgi:hypothetical protein
MNVPILFHLHTYFFIYEVVIPPLTWLCPNYVLHGVPQRLIQTRFDIHTLPVTLQHPAPTQIIPQVVRRHAMEALHPLL